MKHSQNLTAESITTDALKDNYAPLAQYLNNMAMLKSNNFPAEFYQIQRKHLLQTLSQSFFPELGSALQQLLNKNDPFLTLLLVDYAIVENKGINEKTKLQQKCIQLIADATKANKTDALSRALSKIALLSNPTREALLYDETGIEGSFKTVPSCFRNAVYSQHIDIVLIYLEHGFDMRKAKPGDATKTTTGESILLRNRGAYEIYRVYKRWFSQQSKIDSHQLQSIKLYNSYSEKIIALISQATDEQIQQILDDVLGKRKLFGNFMISPSSFAYPTLNAKVSALLNEVISTRPDWFIREGKRYLQFNLGPFRYYVFNNQEIFTSTDKNLVRSYVKFLFKHYAELCQGIETGFADNKWFKNNALMDSVYQLLLKNKHVDIVQELLSEHSVPLSDKFCSLYIENELSIPDIQSHLSFSNIAHICTNHIDTFMQLDFSSEQRELILSLVQEYNAGDCSVKLQCDEKYKNLPCGNNSRVISKFGIFPPPAAAAADRVEVSASSPK